MINSPNSNSNFDSSIDSETELSSLETKINKEPNTTSWLKKYAPNDFDKLLIKNDDKKSMNEWLKHLIDIDTNKKNTTTNLNNNDLVKSEKTTKKPKSKKGKKSKCKYDTNCLFLYGPPGIGKTTMANLLLKKYNYDVLEFNASDTRTAKSIQESLNQIGGSHNVIDFMCNKKTKIAIILDEIDGLSSGDKGGMSEINNIISMAKEKNTPFICISNSVCKKTDSLKRKSLFLKINKPTDFQIKSLVKTISNDENLKLEPSTIEKIVKKAQGDIRRCITLLEYIFRNKNSKKTKNCDNNNDNNDNNIYHKQNIQMTIEGLDNNDINDNNDYVNNNNNVNDNVNDNDEDEDENQSSESSSTNISNLNNDDDEDDFDMLNNEIDNYSRKLTELAPYEMSEKLLNSFSTIDFFLNNYNFDNSMTNWYIYENFIKYIDKNRVGNIKKKVNNIDKIYTCFSLGDLFENEIMKTQNYELFDYINIMKTYGSSYWVNKDLKKTPYNKMGMMNYSTLLNKTSQEYANSKNWQHINENLCINGTTNITSDICNIIFKKLEDDDEIFIERLITDYSLDIEAIEKIIKQSSFYNKEKIQFLTNIKKKIKLYYSK